MKCPYCDSNNRDDAAFCEMCEMPLNIVSERKIITRTTLPQSSYDKQPIYTAPNFREEPTTYASCPHCGCPLSECTPIVKTTVTSTGGGYGFFSGCCGAMLLGPLGLLCGLRGRDTTSTSQTWWACRTCGKEFIEKDAAKKLADTAITGAAKFTLFIALIWQVIHTVIGYSVWVRDIAILMIIGVWVALPEGVKELTGYTIKQLLNSEERMDFYKRCVLYAIGSFLLGAVIGGKAMQYLLS